MEMDGRKDGPFFIGPFWPRQGSEKKLFNMTIEHQQGSYNRKWESSGRASAFQKRHGDSDFSSGELFA